MKAALSKLAAIVFFAGIVVIVSAIASARPAHAAETEPVYTEYEIVRGDTLSGIAADCNTTVAALFAANRDRIADPDVISVGQRIRIERPQQWIVRPGDTLWQIGLCVGQPWGEIAERNGVTDPRALAVGQRLELGSATDGREPGSELPEETPEAPQEPPASPQQPEPQPAPPTTTPQAPTTTPQTPTTTAPGSVEPDATPDRKPSRPWLDGLLIAFAAFLVIAVIAGELIARRRQGTTSKPTMPTASHEVLVALASESNPQPSPNPAIDASLIERIGATAALIDTVRRVGKVRLWWNGTSLTAFVPVEADRRAEPGAVARVCAHLIRTRIAELGEVLVGHELGGPAPGGPGDSGGGGGGGGGGPRPPAGDVPPGGEPQAKPPKPPPKQRDPTVKEGERMLSIGGVQTRVLEYGPEDGRPVICTHGFAAGAELFRSLARRLAAAGYRVYVPDLPGGFGHAPPPVKGPVTPQLVSFLRAAVSKLTPGQRPILVGHSQGAYVGAILASDRHRPLSAFIALAPAGLEQARWMRVIGRPMVGRLFAAMLWIMPRPVRRRFLEFGYRHAVGGRSGAKAFGRRVGDRHTAIRLARSGCQFLGELTAGELEPRRVVVPALYAWGTRDNTAPPTSVVRVLAEAPAAEVRVFDGRGHCPMLEDPDQLAGLILEWAKKTKSKPRAKPRAKGRSSSGRRNRRSR